MATYNIHYTDLNKTPIQIDEATKDNSTDIALFGRVELEYGQDLNEDILHILENFACPEVAGSTLTNSNPDTTISAGWLTKPIEGQLWYNSTRQLVYFWNGTIWKALGNRGNYNANWGQIGDGNQIPRPVNPYTGESYDYDQCIWAVSPSNVPTAYTYMLCTTDDAANVTMKYRTYGDNNLTSGTANFLIISIKGNTNLGNVNVPPPTPAVSMTPTPSLTPSPTPTPSRTPSVSISSSPAPSPSPTPVPSISTTPVPSNTPAPSLTPTPSPFAGGCDRCIADGFDCCVSVDSILPDGKRAGDIKVGDIMSLADDKTLEPFTGIVSYSEPSLQDSVRIVTKDGATLDCSKTAPIPTRDDGLQDAPDVFGKYVAVNINGKSYWDEVIELHDIGEIMVQNITVGDKCFWAGKYSSSYILHHNAKCCYCGGQNCQWIAPNCCLC